MFIIEDSTQHHYIISHKLNPMHHSLNELPLFDMTEFIYRDAFELKGMIGGNVNNGKGDTYF